MNTTGVILLVLAIVVVILLVWGWTLKKAVEVGYGSEEEVVADALKLFLRLVLK